MRGRVSLGRARRRTCNRRVTDRSCLRRRCTMPAPAPPPEPLPPVPDAEALRRFLERAQKTFWESTELQSRWLPKRGLKLETVTRYGVGFMPYSRFAGWTHSVKDAWVLPITDAA